MSDCGILLRDGQIIQPFLWSFCLRDSHETNSPEILFYFKEPRKSETPIDAEQFLKVSEFKKRIGDLGIYGDFDTHESLKTLVVAALTKAIDRISSSAATDPQSGSQTTQEKPLIPATENALTKIDEFDEDIGLIDLAEIVFDAIENFGDSLGTMSNATEKLGARFVTRTNELSKLMPTGDTRQDQKAAKAIVGKIAEEMQRYSHILDQTTPDARRDFSSALRSMQHAVIISNQTD